MKQYGYVIGAVLAVSLVACSGAEQPRRVIGTLAHYGDPVRVEVPSSVGLGEDFQVKVTTYGGGCLDKGDTEVERDGLEVSIRPYDLDTSVPKYPCTADLALYTHIVELRFEEAGEAQLRIFGLRKDASNPQGTLITVTRTLEVR